MGVADCSLVLILGASRPVKEKKAFVRNPNERSSSGKEAWLAKVRVTVINRAADRGPQDCSGGNFGNFIHKEFGGRIPHCTILTITRAVGWGAQDRSSLVFYTFNGLKAL